MNHLSLKHWGQSSKIAEFVVEVRVNVECNYNKMSLNNNSYLDYKLRKQSLLRKEVIVMLRCSGDQKNLRTQKSCTQYCIKLFLLLTTVEI